MVTPKKLISAPFPWLEYLELLFSLVAVNEKWGNNPLLSLQNYPEEYTHPWVQTRKRSSGNPYLSALFSPSLSLSLPLLSLFSLQPPLLPCSALPLSHNPLSPERLGFCFTVPKIYLLSLIPRYIFRIGRESPPYNWRTLLSYIFQNQWWICWEKGKGRGKTERGRGTGDLWNLSSLTCNIPVTFLTSLILFWMSKLNMTLVFQLASLILE